MFLKSLSGIVTDRDGAVPVGLEVIAKCVSSKSTGPFSTKTNRSGMYGLDLPPGHYKVRFVAGARSWSRYVDIARSPVTLDIALDFNKTRDVE
jgi:hypothetical protein